jgi:hypothetical protein
MLSAGLVNPNADGEPLRLLEVNLKYERGLTQAPRQTADRPSSAQHSMLSRRLRMDGTTFSGSPHELYPNSGHPFAACPGRPTRERVRHAPFGAVRRDRSHFRDKGPARASRPTAVHGVTRHGGSRAVLPIAWRQPIIPTTVLIAGVASARTSNCNLGEQQ